MPALEWIDYRRLYPKGCAMGGMAMWELAAQYPDLFTAIGPVAAHHKKELAQVIVRSLPIYGVHGDHHNIMLCYQHSSLFA